MTIGEILAVLPRSARREAMRILEKSTPDTTGMLRATRLLRSVLTPHAACLEQLGLVPDYAVYAMVYYAHNPGGSIYTWISELEAEASRLEMEANKLDRQVQVLQQLASDAPPN